MTRSLQQSGMMCGARSPQHAVCAGPLLHSFVLHQDLEAVCWHQHVFTWHATQAALQLQLCNPNSLILAEGHLRKASQSCARPVAYHHGVEQVIDNGRDDQEPMLPQHLLPLKRYLQVTCSAVRPRSHFPPPQLLQPKRLMWNERAGLSSILQPRTVAEGCYDLILSYRTSREESLTIHKGSIVALQQSPSCPFPFQMQHSDRPPRGALTDGPCNLLLQQVLLQSSHASLLLDLIPGLPCQPGLVVEGVIVALHQPCSLSVHLAHPLQGIRAGIPERKITTVCRSARKGPTQAQGVVLRQGGISCQARRQAANSLSQGVVSSGLPGVVPTGTVLKGCS